MSTAKPKLHIANKYTNFISYRKLSSFEIRNPHLFELSRSAHETWEAAHAWLLEQCRIDVEQRKKKLHAAERRLSRAEAMKKPEAA